MVNLKSIVQFFRRPRHIAVLAVLVPVALCALWIGIKLARTDHSGLWFPPYAADLLSGRYLRNSDPEHVFFVMCDHWEPGSGQQGYEVASDWLDRFEKIAADHNDSQGRPFQYSWFYPIDNFEPAVIERLAVTARRGFGEIEVHWHHHHAGGVGFEQELLAALDEFGKYGALGADADGRRRFAFIHGNWTLDNSGAERFCGVNNELSILGRNGCYADFTFPAIGTAAQPRTINRLFHAADTAAPKSYDENPALAEVGTTNDELLLLPGPLGLNFRNPLILLEFGNIDDAEGSGLVGRISPPESYADYFKPNRIPLWLCLAPRVAGKQNWAFVKVHAHGVQHREVLLGGELEAMLDALIAYCDKRGIALHFVTAREAFNLVKAAEAGTNAPPVSLYDYVIQPPATRTGTS